MIRKSHRWQRTAIAAAATALLALTASEVSALSLGRITVQSALGEALRAEIDIPDINAEEAASLQANVAPPAAFTAAGLEYNQAMGSLQAKLARRTDGRAYLQLSTDRTITEPFIDIILEASWSSGRIVRDYTLLFDPPATKAAAPASSPAPTLAQTASPQAPVAPTPADSMPKLTIPAEMARNITPPPPPPAKSPAAAMPASTKPAAKPEAGVATDRQLTVKPGDTASKIAAHNKPVDVSLDQMLVAMIRSNPDAFSKGNLNRLRAGAVLDVPTAEQAKETSAAQASQMVVAQSKDFDEFRRNLASNAPKASVEAANRAASGNVDAKVEDKKLPHAVPDKLTLSKGALQARNDEANIAKERADQDAATRAAELSKNISDLNNLTKAAVKGAGEPSTATASTATPPAPLEVAASPAIEAVKPTAPVVPPAPVAPPAPAKPKVPVPVPMPTPEPAPSLIDQLLADPVLPMAGGGALLALIGGLIFYRRKQARKNAAHVDSSFLESRLQPDSFFGASGGQRVDTAQGNPVTASSMHYSASQLDAADDVDPVAEADVYLAYGRDLQAEEILKEALRHNPGRLAIHTKLLEIFAKRRDAANYQASANQAFVLTGANSPEWTHICEQGLQIDPTNPLYQPGGATLSAFGSLESEPAEAAGAVSTMAMPTHVESAPPTRNVDLDLDLDFSDDEEAPSIVKSVPSPARPAPAPQPDTYPDSDLDSNGIDFDISASVPLTTPSTPDATTDANAVSMDGLHLDLPDDHRTPEFQSTGNQHLTAPLPMSAAEDDALQFDLGSLSLDLDDLPSEADDATSNGANSHETKLALAEEFVSIGDHDGARALIEEVIAESTGDLREKAQRALANLN